MGPDGGRVLAPIIGPFAEMSSHVYDIADLISSLLASEHCSFFAEKPSEAKGMFLQRIYRAWGLSAHLGWARLLLDRSRDLVQTPEPWSQGGRGRWNLDDSEDFENENYRNPDTRCYGNRH